jgi:hypothetical protein
MLRHAALAAALCLAACQPATPPDAARDDRAAERATPVADAASAASLPDAAPPPAAGAEAVAPAPSTEPADGFEGWYFEKGGVAMVQACGQSVPLEVSDAAFLRQLKARMGGRQAPVYVRLAVRPAAGSKLEVAEVRQFGVDEGPAPDCPLVAGS